MSAVKDPVLHGLDLFFYKYKFLHFKRGEVILRAGDQPQGIFYLKSGYCRVYSFSRNGEELTLIIFKPGDIFPVSWAINPTPIGYFVESMTASELWRVPRESFLEFVRDKPEILFEVLRRMMERFLGLMKRMEHLVFGNAQSKVASILLICAERFGKPASRLGGKQGQATVIDVPLTHSDIATLVGMTRETVSIEMKKLQKEKLISYKGKYLAILNSPGLKKQSLLES